GDNGLIAVLYGSFRGDELLITQWLMSCRVFNRGVEQMTMNHVVARCRERGVRRIIGEYRATKKNVVVKDLYERLGFARDKAEDTSESEVQFWALDLSGYEDLPHSIEVNVYGSESK